MATTTDPRPDADVVQTEDHEHWGGNNRHVLPVVVKVLFLGTVIALAVADHAHAGRPGQLGLPGRASG